MGGKNFDDITFRWLAAEDLGELKAFYADGLRALERKEFFLPFTDPDLEALIKGGGVAVGAYIGGVLAGVSCVDMDAGYGALLKGHINTFYPHITDESKVYEYSGVMTSPEFRRAGVAGRIYERLIDYSVKNLPGGVLCAVVQLQNVASLSFFYRRGFRLTAAKYLEDIDFGFLAKRIDGAPQGVVRVGQGVVETPSGQDLNGGQGALAAEDIYLDFLDYEGYAELLGKGYAGVDCKAGQMVMRLLTRPV